MKILIYILFTSLVAFLSFNFFGNERDGADVIIEEMHKSEFASKMDLPEENEYALSEEMHRLQLYMNKLYFSGKSSNKKLSDFYVHEIEEITRHDVVAFTRSVSESLGPEKKWVHYGLPHPMW